MLTDPGDMPVIECAMCQRRFPTGRDCVIVVLYDQDEPCAHLEIHCLCGCVIVVGAEQMVIRRFIVAAYTVRREPEAPALTGLLIRACNSRAPGISPTYFVRQAADLFVRRVRGLTGVDEFLFYCGELNEEDF
jgi:hypothetical protein